MKARARALAIAVATLAGPAAGSERAAEAAVQYALENLASGVTSVARIGALRRAITPLRTWRTVGGHFCREFEIASALPDGRRDRTRAVRCRDDDGIWRKVEG